MAAVADRSGRIRAVRGAVVDVSFARDVLPAIGEALHVDTGLGSPLIAEVQSHIDTATARAVALHPPPAWRGERQCIRREDHRPHRSATQCSAGCST